MFLPDSKGRIAKVRIDGNGEEVFVYIGFYADNEDPVPEKELTWIEKTHENYIHFHWFDYQTMREVKGLATV